MTLIFDLDGTLIDSRRGVLASFQQAAQTVFPSQDFDYSSVRLGPPVRKMFEQFFPHAPPTQIDDLVRAFRLHYDREGAFATELFEGAVDLLAECARRRIELHIATNKPSQASMIILQHLKLNHFFCSVLAADSVTPPFPSKSHILQYLLAVNTLAPENVLYVGDSIEDATAAEDCGIRFVWAAYGYGKVGAPRAVFKTINKLAELRAILLQ